MDHDLVAGVPTRSIVHDSIGLASIAKTYAPAFAVDHCGADFAEAHSQTRIGYVRDLIKLSSERVRKPPVTSSRGFSCPWY